MNLLGIIPARYASSRLPGKPLVDILGKPMIQWVYESANKALNRVVVATDDVRIQEAVEAFGGIAVLTSGSHENGTSRVAEAFAIIKNEYDTDWDVIVNIQGDEPMLAPEQLNELTACFHEPEVKMATLAALTQDKKDLEGHSEVFLVTDVYDNALYFSRNVIPFIKDQAQEEWTQHYAFKKHVGLYAFTPQALNKYISLESSDLEKCEGLEQNRWLEAGEKLRVAYTRHQSYCVDTQEDLDFVIQKMQEKI